jgi:hypothetical protein
LLDYAILRNIQVDVLCGLLIISRVYGGPCPILTIVVCPHLILTYRNRLRGWGTKLVKSLPVLFVVFPGKRYIPYRAALYHSSRLANGTCSHTHERARRYCYWRGPRNPLALEQQVLKSGAVNAPGKSALNSFLLSRSPDFGTTKKPRFAPFMAVRRSAFAESAQ